MAAQIRDIKSLMLEVKLVLLGDDGQPIKPNTLTNEFEGQNKYLNSACGDGDVAFSGQDKTHKDSPRNTFVSTCVTTGTGREHNTNENGKAVLIEHVTKTSPDTSHVVNESNK